LSGEACGGFTVDSVQEIVEELYAAITHFAQIGECLSRRNWMRAPGGVLILLTSLMRSWGRSSAHPTGL
jgi:hypothetical protein